jgi:hypothetical protein
VSEKPKMFLPGEVILIHVNQQPAFFARIENIQADRKKGWWQMEMLPLSIPLHTTIWTLDDDQLCGAPFTMQGHPVRIDRVTAPLLSEIKRQDQKPTQQDHDQDNQDARVVSMFDID